MLGPGRPPLTPTKPEPGLTRPPPHPRGEGCSPPCPSGPHSEQQALQLLFSHSSFNRAAEQTSPQNLRARQLRAGHGKTPGRERGVGLRGLAPGCITTGSWTSPSIALRIHSSRGPNRVLPVHLLAPRPSTPSGPHPNPPVVTRTRGKGDGSDRPSCGGSTEAAARIPEAQQYSLAPWALAGLKL